MSKPPSSWVEIGRGINRVIFDVWEPTAFAAYSSDGTVIGTDVYMRGGAEVFVRDLNPDTLRELVDAHRERIRAWEGARRFPGEPPKPARKVKRKRAR